MLGKAVEIAVKVTLVLIVCVLIGVPSSVLLLAGALLEMYRRA